MTIAIENLCRILNHIFLPPKLPQSGENEPDIDLDLVRVLELYMNTYVEEMCPDDWDDSDEISVLYTARSMLSQHLHLRSDVFTMEKIMEGILNMRTEGSGRASSFNL